MDLDNLVVGMVMAQSAVQHRRIFEEMHRLSKTVLSMQNEMNILAPECLLQTVLSIEEGTETKKSSPASNDSTTDETSLSGSINLPQPLGPPKNLPKRLTTPLASKCITKTLSGVAARQAIQVQPLISTMPCGGAGGSLQIQGRVNSPTLIGAQSPYLRHGSGIASWYRQTESHVNYYTKSPSPARGGLGSSSSMSKLPLSSDAKRHNIPSVKPPPNYRPLDIPGPQSPPPQFRPLSIPGSQSPPPNFRALDISGAQSPLPNYRVLDVSRPQSPPQNYRSLDIPRPTWIALKAS